MTGEEIQSLAESHCDDILDDADTLKWLKEVLTSLGADARNIDTQDFTVTDLTVDHALPADFIAAIKAVQNTKDHYSYTIFNNTIRFNVSGLSTLHYYRKVTLPAALSTEIDTHYLIHPALALFLASRFKRKDDDENPDARQLYGDFLAAMKSALYEIDNPERGPFNTVKLVRFW